MKKERFGLVLAAKEHVIGGNPITLPESIIIFGVPNLWDVIKDLRKDGWVVQSHRIPYAAVVKRINEFAVLEPPKNLPIREIMLTEYWINQ